MRDGATRTTGGRAKLIGAVIAGVALILGLRVAVKLLFWGVRRTRRTIRFGLALATFRVYRRCPDCKGVIRRDARVCRHCGYRR
jgi:ribosomal protein L32